MKFFFQGQGVEARPGDTLAAALYRGGQRIFSRSFKYHRARGLLCVSGNCPNCMMNVDGVPNVRTCITPVREGANVKSQNAFPSLQTDFLSITQHFDRLMPVGWYYKTFTYPAMWHAAEPIIRRAAGLGEVLSAQPAQYEHAWMHADTAVVGGGWTGIHAALAAAERGDEVVLIDDQVALGGQGRYRRNREVPVDVMGKLLHVANIKVLRDSDCFGMYEGNLLGVLQRHPHAEVRERLVHVRTRHVVVATGTYETPILFPNNDLVGVMLSTGVQRLLHLHGVVPGKRAVIVGNGEGAEELSSDLRAAGIEIAAVVESGSIVSATGSGQVTGIRLSTGGVSCDLVVVCGPRVPHAGLVAQAGGKLEWSVRHGAFLPADLPMNVSVVGDAAGEMVRDDAISPLSNHKRAFVCLCSDVSCKDLCDGVAEGFDQIEMLKRYTTATMGPCQGRMCQLSAIKVCSHQTGRALAETGVTTSRPPSPSVTLGALAGPGHHPTRRTPMHYLHEGLGAVWMDMGGWMRPRYYKRHRAASESESVLLEHKAVRESVGIIDVSTLGKLDVRGKDAGKLLDIVYTHRFSDLRKNRVRYALMCDQGGIILDDGTISRLEEDRYFVTTTSGNLDFVYQWLQWHLIGTNWDVHICNVTAGYGAMNLAGPQSRNVLEKLVDCDLSSAAFPYMGCREARIGEVPAILLRIGFVGETGWEIHCPAESAHDLWQRLLETGKDVGIQAFGVEAQRLLRLEKRHVIVGVDTDALTNPYEAGLGWAVKLEKKDFIGRGLLSRAARGEAREKLVGFILNEAGVPKDGAAIVLDGRSAGRVTSSRFSPVQKAAIGLAWVKESKASEGASIQVRIEGKLTSATVTLRPFYDPEGLRLRQ